MKKIAWNTSKGSWDWHVMRNLTGENEVLQDLKLRQTIGSIIKLLGVSQQKNEDEAYF